MPTAILTGSQGFLGTYICRELLNNNYFVVGVDNYSKYGKVNRPHDKHPKFKFRWADLSLATGRSVLQNLIENYKPEFLIAGAARIGGIKLFHDEAYDLLSINERITANTFDAALWGWQKEKLKQIIVLSSSMVFENATMFPTPETHINECPSPKSSYGFQKLMTEVYARAIHQQYGLPYTIIRPFNAAGCFEDEEIDSYGNKKMVMSHVLPDFCRKTLKRESPFTIYGAGNQVRCFTNGSDIARGIRLAMESFSAVNDDFNISSFEPTTIIDLAKKVWKYEYNEDLLNFKFLEPFEHDVQNRVPDINKAKNVLGFEAKISLDDSIKEVMEYIKEHAQLYS